VMLRCFPMYSFTARSNSSHLVGMTEFENFVGSCVTPSERPALAKPQPAKQVTAQVTPEGDQLRAIPLRSQWPQSC
jgi:hypothetical protein